MSMLYLNQIAKQAAKGGGGGGSTGSLPGQLSSRFMHPTLWTANPYHGLMLGAGAAGLGAGLLSADSDDNQMLRGIAGAGLGMAGTTALNNMGVFDDAIREANKIRGGKGADTPKGDSTPKADSTPKVESAAKGGDAAAKAGKKLSDMEYLAANTGNMTPGEIRDFRKLVERQQQLGTFTTGTADRLSAQLAKQKVMAVEQAARKAMLQNARAGDLGLLKRLGLRLPFFGSRIR
jgi:hypothetical protein